MYSLYSKCSTILLQSGTHCYSLQACSIGILWNIVVSLTGTLETCSWSQWISITKIHLWKKKKNHLWKGRTSTVKYKNVQKPIYKILQKCVVLLGVLSSMTTVMRFLCIYFTGPTSFLCLKPMDSFGTWRKWKFFVFFVNAEFYRVVWTINALLTVRSEMLPFSGNNQNIKILESPRTLCHRLCT